MLHDPQERHRSPELLPDLAVVLHLEDLGQVAELDAACGRPRGARAERRLYSAKSAAVGSASRQPLITTMSSPRLVPTSTR